MNILIIGQCSLHWGRMEFGNIGNYYIIEPFIRQLHKNFTNCNIKSTFQMSERFCKDENIEVLPMELYYGWRENDYLIAKKELEISRHFFDTGVLLETTPYIKEVLESDLIIDFSGDIWGDNADFLGDDRFFVGLCKDRVAQLLRKKTVMIAGSPGPFFNKNNLNFAKEVFENFDLVTNRETLSRKILNTYNFNTDNLADLSCPAFLFEPLKGKKITDIINKENLNNSSKPIVGFVLCGWNFEEGPFDKWPRNDDDYVVFAEAIEYIETLGAKVCLMSHSNGFIPGNEPFELIHGRDYPIIKQLQEVVKNRGKAKDVVALDGVYDAWTTKGIIGEFDMLVSGRVHAAVAALSQNVPTVIIDYGHEPRAHKLKGFAIEAGAENYVADPSKSSDLIEKIDTCFNNLSEYKHKLEIQIPLTKSRAEQNFKLIKNII